jgi:hypothetical protein
MVTSVREVARYTKILVRCKVVISKSYGILKFFHLVGAEFHKLHVVTCLIRAWGSIVVKALHY